MWRWEFLSCDGTWKITQSNYIKRFGKVIRATTDFSRFSSIRAICKVLQDLDVIENDVDVFNNDDFRNTLAKALNVK